MDSQTVVVHILDASSICLDFCDAKTTINDVKVAITKQYPHFLPPEVAILSYPDAKPISMHGESDVIAPSIVYAIFKECEHSDAIWLEAFVSFARAGDAQGIRRILRHCDPENSDVRYTFFEACKFGRMHVVQAHVKAGIKWEKGGFCGKDVTALSLCARQNQTDIAQYLLGNGWNPNLSGACLRTPLHTAAKYGHIEFVNLLMEVGVENKVDLHGGTPLHGACERGHLRVAMLLLEQGMDKDRATYAGCTPLHCSSKSGRENIVQLLLEYGVDAAKCDVSGKTPLHYAAENGRVDIVKLLLDHGVDKDKMDYIGETPLHSACKLGHVHCVRHLLEQGVRRGAADYIGVTPLHCAASGGYLDIAKLLLHGVEKSIKDDNGRTALHCAAENGHAEMISLLLQNGLSKYSLDGNDRMPLRCAWENGHADCAHVLEQDETGCDLSMDAQAWWG